MDKLAKLALMDKVSRELEDLEHSQTAVLKKVAQIEADNINLGVALLDTRLTELYEKVDAGVSVVAALREEFTAHRNKFYNDNDLGSLQDPTA